MREQLSGDEKIEEKELLAHDEHILIYEKSVQVKKEIKQNQTISRKRVNCKQIL